METTNSCLKSYQSNYGPFLNYYMVSVSKRVAQRIADETDAQKRGGLHVSKEDKTRIQTIKALAKTKNMDIDNPDLLATASKMMGIAVNEIQQSLQLYDARNLIYSISGENDINIHNDSSSDPLLEVLRGEEVNRLLDLVDAVFSESDEKQKEIISLLFTQRLLCFDEGIVKRYKINEREIWNLWLAEEVAKTGAVPTSRKLALKVMRKEASISRTYKHFSQQVLELLTV